MNRILLSGVGIFMYAAAVAVGCGGIDGDGQDEDTADLHDQDGEDTAQIQQAMNVDCSVGSTCAGNCYGGSASWNYVPWDLPGDSCTAKAKYFCKYVKGTDYFNGACVGTLY